MRRLLLALALLLGLALPAHAQLATDLTACWTLQTNGTTSTGSDDLTANGSPTFGTMGKVGNAVSFVAANSQSLSHVDTATLSPAGSFTIAAWVNITSGGALRAIAAKQDGATIAGSEYLLYYDNVTGFFTFAIYGGGSAGTIAASTFGGLSTSTFYLVIGWYDAGGNSIGVSVNNTADTTAWGGGINNTATDFALGSTRGGTPGNFWDGLVDEVPYWQGRVLSAGDRTSLWNGGSGKDCATIIADTGGGGGTAHHQTLTGVGQ